MVMPKSSRTQALPPDESSMEGHKVTDKMESALMETAKPEPRTSVMAILCVFCAALGFFLLPALAALPLGIFALRAIDASDGRLRGRHLAVVGLCVSVVALSLWFLFFALTWAGVNLMNGLIELVKAPFN